MWSPFEEEKATVGSHFKSPTSAYVEQGVSAPVAKQKVDEERSQMTGVGLQRSPNLAGLTVQPAGSGGSTRLMANKMATVVAESP